MSINWPLTIAGAAVVHGVKWLMSRDSSASTMPAASPSTDRRAPDWKLRELVEVETIVEHDHYDHEAVRLDPALEGLAGVDHQVSVSHRWMREVSWETIDLRSAELGISAFDLITAEIKAALETRYQRGYEDVEELTRSVHVRGLQPGADIVVEVEWRRIVQEGRVILTDSISSETRSVPYRAVIGMEVKHSIVPRASA